MGIPVTDKRGQLSLLPAGAGLAAALLVCLVLTWLLVRLDVAAPAGLWLKYSYLTGPLVIAAVCHAISRCRNPWLTGGVVTVFMVSASLLVLIGVWRAGVSDGFMIGGLLPYSDAAGYYVDALRLLHGEKFSAFSSRRPLFPALLAGILNLADLDLRTTLVMLTAISMIAICLAARETQRTLGLGAGILMLISLFMFYRRYIGSTLTEHLGLTLGCLAFALICRASVTRRWGPALLGLFLLSLGLNARAGPFLILPASVVWAAWTFRARHRSVLPTLAIGGAVVLLGFVLNRVLLQVAGIPGAAYSNFSYTLYGLVFGGGWSLALQQHPELAALAPLEQANRVYALAWEEIRSNPWALAAGSLRAWTGFFVGRSGTWFSYILYLSPDWADLREMLLADGVSALNFRRDLWVLLDVAAREGWIIALNALLAVGVVVLWRNPRRPLALLTIATWAGILLSVPFVPPWDADNMRAYATTLPFVIMLPVMGLFCRRPDKLGWGTGEAGGAPSPSAGLWSVSAILLALQVLGPMMGIAAGLARSAPGQEPRCPAGCRDTRQSRLVHLDGRNAIHLVDSSVGGRIPRVGNAVSLRHLRERKHIKDYPDVWHMWRSLSRLPPGTTLALAYDIRRGGAVYVQSVSTAFPGSPGVVSLCGEVVRHEWIEWFRIESLAECRWGEEAALQETLQ